MISTTIRTRSKKESKGFGAGLTGAVLLALMLANAAPVSSRPLYARQANADGVVVAPAVVPTAAPGFTALPQPEMSNGDIYSMAIPDPPQVFSDRMQALNSLTSAAMAQANAIKAATAASAASSNDVVNAEVAAPVNDISAEAAFYQKTIDAQKQAAEAAATPTQTTTELAATDASSALAGNPNQGTEYQQMIAGQQAEFAGGAADPATAAAAPATAWDPVTGLAVPAAGIDSVAAPVAAVDPTVSVAPADAPVAVRSELGKRQFAHFTAHQLPVPAPALPSVPAVPSVSAVPADPPIPALPVNGAPTPALPTDEEASFPSTSIAATSPSVAGTDPATTPSDSSIPVAAPVNPTQVQDDIVPSEDSTPSATAKDASLSPATTVLPSSLAKGDAKAVNLTVTLTLGPEPTGIASGNAFAAIDPVLWRTMTIMIPADAAGSPINLSSLSSMMATPTATSEKDAPKEKGNFPNVSSASTTASAKEAVATSTGSASSEKATSTAEPSMTGVNGDKTITQYIIITAGGSKETPSSTAKASSTSVAPTETLPPLLNAMGKATATSNVSAQPTSTPVDDEDCEEMEDDDDDATDARQQNIEVEDEDDNEGWQSKALNLFGLGRRDELSFEQE